MLIAKLYSRSYRNQLHTCNLEESLWNARKHEKPSIRGKLIWCNNCRPFDITQWMNGYKFHKSTIAKLLLGITRWVVTCNYGSSFRAESELYRKTNAGHFDKGNQINTLTWKIILQVQWTIKLELTKTTRHTIVRAEPEVDKRPIIFHPSFDLMKNLQSSHSTKDRKRPISSKPKCHLDAGES